MNNSSEYYCKDVSITIPFYKLMKDKKQIKKKNDKIISSSLSSMKIIKFRKQFKINRLSVYLSQKDVEEFIYIFSIINKNKKGELFECMKLFRWLLNFIAKEKKHYEKK